MIVYSVQEIDGTSNGSMYFKTKREAMECARAHMETPEWGYVTVIKHTIGRRCGRDLAIALLNDEAWCSESKTIFDVNEADQK